MREIRRRKNWHERSVLRGRSSVRKKPASNPESFSLCYVSHDSLIEGIGQSQIVPLANLLVKSGIDVSVLSLEKSISSHEEANLDEAVRWVQRPFGRIGALGALSRVIRISISLPHASIYHARGDLAATSVHLRGRTRVLWDVRGLWIDQKVIIGTFPDIPCLIWIGRRLESFVAKRAGAFTTLSAAVEEPLRKRNKNLPVHHKVIPTCVDLDRFKYSPLINNDRLLLLSGVFNNYYDLRLIETVGNHLSRNGFRVVWHRGGESITEDLKIENLAIHKSRYVDMPEIIASSSLGLAICKTNIGDSLKGVMPTKVAEFLAVGRPILISEGMGDLDWMIKEHSVGWIVNPETDLEELTKEILALIQDPDLSKRCRAVAEKYFNIKTATSQYLELYRLLERL